MRPIFSVIIAAYNSEQYIKQCLDSVIKQTERLIEVIVVNDGSQDNTREIIETYAEKDHRINVIHKQENQGKSKAIIDALERVTGEYVTLLDSDDWINENYYTEIKKKLVNAPEVLIAGYILEPGGKKICTHYKIDCMMSGIDLVKSNPLVHTSYDASFSWRMFFKTDFLKENHFMPDTKIVIGEDTEFNLRVLKIAKKTLAVDCAGYHYRTNNQNSLVHQSYKPTLENDLNLQYPTRRNFCKEKKYIQNMARYYTDVMIFNVIRNAKQQPNGLQIDDMKRLLNAKWLRESYKLIKYNGYTRSSCPCKEKILRFCMEKRLFVLCYLYYKIR